MKESKKRSRNYVILIYGVIVILIALVGMRFADIYFTGVSDVLNQETYDKYYVMISDDSHSAFWNSVYESAYNYGLGHNIYVEDLSATFSGELSREELMRIAIASRVDGILVSADDSEEMNRLIDDATANNIPVVTMYNDAASSSRISYVGVDNYNIGREYGRQALTIAHDIYDSYQDDVINVVVLVDLVPTTDQMMVYSTVQETFESDVLASRLQLSTLKIDSTNTFSVEETIRDLFISEDLPDIIICLSELNTTCVSQAVIDYNKVGLVNILGYYDSEAILSGISRRIISSTIKIDADQMGEYAVDALVTYGEAGFANQYFAVDIDVINSYNIDRYLEGDDEET